MRVPVIVVGQPQSILVSEGSIARVVAEKAIRQAAYETVDLDQWEMRGCDGNLLIWGAPVPSDPRLFLNQRAGVGA